MNVLIYILKYLNIKQRHSFSFNIYVCKTVAHLVKCVSTKINSCFSLQEQFNNLIFLTNFTFNGDCSSNWNWLLVLELSVISNKSSSSLLSCYGIVDVQMSTFRA